MWEDSYFSPEPARFCGVCVCFPHVVWGGRENFAVLELLVGTNLLLRMCIAGRCDLWQHALDVRTNFMAEGA